MPMLWKKLWDVTFNGKNALKSGATMDFESGSSLKIAGTTVTSSADELNIMDGVTATAAELNRSTDISARVVTTTATALSLTLTEHAERVVLVNTNSTVANTITLPAATGTGAKFTVINNIAQTQGSVVIAAAGTNVMNGIAVGAHATTTTGGGSFLTSASSDKVTYNRTTTGGLGLDYFEAIDSSTGVWTVRVIFNGNGTLATPFSET